MSADEQKGLDDRNHDGDWILWPPIKVQKSGLARLKQ